MSQAQLGRGEGVRYDRDEMTEEVAQASEPSGAADSGFDYPTPG